MHKRGFLFHSVFCVKSADRIKAFFGIALECPEQLFFTDRAEVNGRGVGLLEAHRAVHLAVVEDAVEQAEHVAGFMVEDFAGAA